MFVHVSSFSSPQGNISYLKKKQHFATYIQITLLLIDRRISGHVAPPPKLIGDAAFDKQPMWKWIHILYSQRIVYSLKVEVFEVLPHCRHLSRCEKFNTAQVAFLMMCIGENRE